MTCYTCIQITFDLIVDFRMTFYFLFFVQRLLHTFMDLRLDFVATKRRLAVVGLTAKRRFVAEKSRRKSTKVCNSLWTKKK